MEKIYLAGSLKDYLEAVREIADQDRNGSEDKFGKPKVLWFRGLDYLNHPLIPSLFREEELFDDLSFKNKNYSRLIYAEDIRTQHYIAKNYHLFTKLPSSRVEWLEVMQHHETKTRALDWSESSIHSLIFAIEPFLNGKRYQAEVCRKQAPCVWVLCPGEMNGRGFQELLGNDLLIPQVTMDLSLQKDEKDILSENVRRCREFLQKESSVLNEKMGHLHNIVNLSTINDEIQRDRVRLKEMLLHGEVFLLFYLLSRIYSDGLVLSERNLPPLAVVQPYHSERIKVQKGVFTIFPFYEEKDGDDSLRKNGLEPNAMQYNPIARDCLERIELEDPERIAYELLQNGINVSWLYPERPIISSEIENHQIY